MSIDESVTGRERSESGGFTIGKRRRWPYLIVALTVVVAVAALVIVQRSISTPSPNEVSGATLQVVYAGTIFQHRHWLQQVLDANPGFREEAATGPFFHWVFGIWSDRYRTPQDIPVGATVSLLADPANNAQGLWYLAQAGLITLRPDADITALTQKDIIANPKNLRFTLLDFGAQPRALPDLDAIVGYAESFLAAGVSQDKLIFAPKSPDEFASVLTVGSDYVGAENVQNLIRAFKDPRVQTFIAEDPEVRKLALPGDPA